MNVDLTGKGVALVTLGENMNGPRLVENDRATTLGVERQNERMAFILSPNAENILTSQVTNGSLNGLEMAYATAIDVMAEIDNLAFVLVREMNAIHQQGLNLEGEKSGDLFRAIDVVIEPNPTNTGNASTEIKVNDFTKVRKTASPLLMTRMLLSGMDARMMARSSSAAAIMSRFPALKLGSLAHLKVLISLYMIRSKGALVVSRWRLIGRMILRQHRHYLYPAIRAIVAMQ